MSHLRPLFLVGATVVMLIGSASSQSLPPAFPRDGATKLLENDRVIVWDVQLQKGQKAAMHMHPNDSVSVTLTPGGYTDHGPDGKSEDRMFKAGDVSFTSKGRQHFEVGLTDPPRRAIVTELKPVPPGPPPTAGKYPPSFPREGSTKILENDRVILWDVTLENGKRTAVHTHPYDFMSVTITPGAIRDVEESGVAEPRSFAVGQLRYQPKGRVHADEGASVVPRRSVIIEFK